MCVRAIKSNTFSISLQDLATQIRYWDKFVAECRQTGVAITRAKRFVPCDLAAWMVGLTAFLESLWFGANTK